MTVLSFIVFLTLMATATPSIAGNYSNETYACNLNESLCNVTTAQPCNKGDGSSPTCSLYDNLTASWDCCLCNTNQTHCCGTCNASLPSTTGMTTVGRVMMPSTTCTPAVSLPSPPEYVRILVIFFDRCSEYVEKQAEFIESFRSSVANLTNIDRNRLEVDGINCSEGAKPYCGLDVDTIHKHHRARRAVGGGRGRGGGSDKKKDTGIDSGFFKDYYNVQEPDCDGLAVNATLKPPSLNKTLELMISHLSNRTFDINVYDGLTLTAELILFAEKGTHFSIHTAPPLPLYYPPLSPKEVPPLKTDLRPLIFTAGSIIALVTLYIILRLIKHSIFLRMNKFTKINSDKTRKKVMKIDMEEKKTKVADPFISPYNMAHNKFPTVKQEALRSTYDWTAPAQLPNTLAPAYRPTDLTGQQSPPRLILDESDEEISSPIGGASVIDLDVGEDEEFDDILLSDSEDNEKQKRKGTASRSLASGKSRGSGKSSNSDENRRSGTGRIKSRNRVSPNDMRRPSAVSKSSARDSSV